MTRQMIESEATSMSMRLIEKITEGFKFPRVIFEEGIFVIFKDDRGVCKWLKVVGRYICIFPYTFCPYIT